ncbi:p143 [Lambdina fiscellaria nucleopolyhedrovirus]|uniref:p143 n=1 Tax=Lambdina fiscellaria nucleopolyhedrovirus TaxID=1642929 RepID=A0A0E3Z608_9ABAC|nr:p143 [Lambdina fiscellaria nucleopolyhedrovirus]AKC91682.1 p143 [Lambdina fiscellaria nucleopolyhedrovirus]
MAAQPINISTAFDNIFFNVAPEDDHQMLKNFDSVDCLVLFDERTKQKKIVKSLANFKKLVCVITNQQQNVQRTSGNINEHGATYNVLSPSHSQFFNEHADNNHNETLTTTNDCDKRFCHNKHDCKIVAHDWSVQGNCFTLMVKPFIKCSDYNKLIERDLNFEQFIESNRKNHANESFVSGEYRYWPNIAASFFGWRQYLHTKFNVDVGEYVPLQHNKRLGNVNLFVFSSDTFLNVELCMMCCGKKLFVNGRTDFSKGNFDDLFTITMADGSKGSCKINPKLVYSKKNLFDYIRDDINLTECTTAQKYRHMIKVDLKHLRAFKENGNVSRVKTRDRLRLTAHITASSENDEIEKHVRKCIERLNECMIDALASNEIADSRNESGGVLADYLARSEFMNFDYLIVVVWRLMLKQDDFDYAESDIRLYMELLCEILFADKGSEYRRAVAKCQPYFKLLPKIFARFCNHWTLFAEEDALEALACYYAIHYLIYNKASSGTADSSKWWDYTYDNALDCGATIDVLCKGFFKKIQSANACMVFNGKHYVAVKKDEDLFKLTEKTNAITMSSVKFNNWKYLYFTEEGVYNLFINDYHSSTPFILGNTLMGALTKKNERTYLPESTIAYMLENGKNEENIYKMYHIAKVCRDIKTYKVNVSIMMAFDNCVQCTHIEKQMLNESFREVWAQDDVELIATGVYLNECKMRDLLINLKCETCQQRRIVKKCDCVHEMQVDRRALKIAVIFELFSNSRALTELIWSLLYSSMLYSKMLCSSELNNLQTSRDRARVVNNARYFQENRTTILNYLYRKIDKLDFVDNLIWEISDFDAFVEILKQDIENGGDSGNDSDAEHQRQRKQNGDTDTDTDNDDNDDNKLTNVDKNSYKNESNGDALVDEFLCLNVSEKVSARRVVNRNENVIESYYNNYCVVLNTLKRWNVWWDKLIVARDNDDLSSWLVRFYMRVIISKVNLSEYSYHFVKKIVTGYLYYRSFTNFNYVNSLLMMHFGASMGIPSDYEKCCIYLNGEPGSGKSSSYELMENIVVVHKHDAEQYTLSKKDTDEMEANKLISQLYVINEMKECNDSFFKNTADSTKSNAVCRKYQGSQKYEGNYKLMIINNKPLHITNYDKGVRNRFAIVYTEHVFEENLPFSGSVYKHIKTKKFPMERSYFDNLVTPVRLFLSHILMYKRNNCDGYVSYKHLIKNDPVHNHNLMCMDINNSAINALIYVLGVKIRYGACMIDENKVDKIIELACPYVEILIHESMKFKRNANRIQQLCSDFKKRFKKNYRPQDGVFINLDMALSKKDFNTHTPTFRC